MSHIDITASGAILLGEEVSCDGFHIDRPVRVQTHWHADHMRDFGPSKRGEIVLTQETFDLLIPKHPDLLLRANVHVIHPGEVYDLLGPPIKLLRSSHCLGAVQAAVQSDGVWVGYSGDFSWPLDEVNAVEELVVDATYGDPATDRGYDQATVEEALISHVRKGLMEGPVQLLGRGGTVERALAALQAADAVNDVPVLASDGFCAALDVHRQSAYPVPNAVEVDSDEGLAALRDGRYVRVWGLGQAMSNDVLPGTTIRLTKYRTTRPVEEVTERSLVIGVSNHADYAGTMEFVAKSGARLVLTDGTRSSPAKARALANAISRELGVKARAATPVKSYEYGR